MKLLHTADLHLGRQFHGQSLETDHQFVLSQIHDAIVKESVDVLIIAGDVFDRASPPTTAVRLFNEFVDKLTQESDVAIVMIAGNHDSGDRIGSMGILIDRRRALICGPLDAKVSPLIIDDGSGPVAISALPFGYEFAARECFDDTDINTPEDVLRAQLTAARDQIPDKCRWIIVAHTFVAGGSTSESERPLTNVGGIEFVQASVFEGASYVALGHLHRPQSAGAENIRYSGSPLAFGFDEAGPEKSMSLVDIEADGSAVVELVPFVPLRAVRILRGKLADLIAIGETSDDFFKVILTDEGSLIDPMKQIRRMYPNAVSLSYERDEDASEVTGVDTALSALNEPTKVISEFLTLVRGRIESKAERGLIEKYLSVLQVEEKHNEAN